MMWTLKWRIKSLVKHLRAWWHDSEWIVLPEIPSFTMGSWEYIITEHFLFETVSNYVSKNGENAFSRYILDDDAEDKIINILHFYHIRKKEKELRIQKLWDRSRDIREAFYIKIDSFGTKQSHNYSTSAAECNALIQLAMELDSELYQETQEMLHLCVDIRKEF